LKKRLSNQDITDIATRFLNLKQKAKTGRKKAVNEFKDYQKFISQKLSFLVEIKTKRYRQFDNYADLCQVGYEALFMSLETFDASKSDFSYWALRYIGTKVSRAANTHSTIRVPLKKAKAQTPYKVDNIPIIVDTAKSPQQYFEEKQDCSFIHESIEELPELQKKAIRLYYGFEKSVEKETILNVMKNMNISRMAVLELLRTAESNLKEKLASKMDR